MNPRRILVTGGSGFIGTHLVDAIIASGDIPLNLDIQTPRSATQAAYWRKADIMEIDAIKQAVTNFRPDAIINLAAIADLTMTVDQMRVNFVGVENLILASGAAAHRPRLVHVSTQLVAEPGHVPVAPRDYRPYTDYGHSKARSEEVLWTKGDGLTWMIARPTNVWGPLHPSFALSTWKYLKRRWYMLPSGSAPIRSYGYVENVAAQLLTAAKADSALINRQVVYVGDEPMLAEIWLDGFSIALAGKPVRRIPRKLLKITAHAGELLKWLSGSAPFDLGRLYRISTDYAVPMESGFQILGRGHVSVNEGIAKTVAWLRNAHQEEF